MGKEKKKGGIEMTWNATWARVVVFNLLLSVVLLALVVMLWLRSPTVQQRVSEYGTMGDIERRALEVLERVGKK